VKSRVEAWLKGAPVIPSLAQSIPSFHLLLVKQAGGIFNVFSK
jgi:hypothetical protein